MSDESQLDIAIGRAQRAQDLINNELLQEAFAAIEAAYLKGWRETKIEDVAGREKLFLAVNVVGKVKDHLASVLRNGTLAAAEIKQIADIAERKKMKMFGFERAGF
jgi:hypothetical protein